MEVKLPQLDFSYYERAQRHLDNLTKPQGSLGYLEEIAKKFFVITENDDIPLPLKKAIYIFAGDHGITEEGVSAYPSEVTKQMIFNFLSGGAAINVIAKRIDAKVYVVDVGVKEEIYTESDFFIKAKIISGTKNFLKEPAMSQEEAEKVIDLGFKIAQEAFKKDYKLLIPGDMGIGNTTASAALLCALLNESPQNIVGLGTGINIEAWNRKVQIVQTVLEKYTFKDPIDILAKVGGAEIGAIAGFFLGSASKRIPIVIDGFISLAGLALALAIEPAVKNFVFSGHCSQEKGASLVLKKLNLRPILNLDMRLGEGTGAALASFVIETALYLYKDMATFDQAKVSRKISEKTNRS